MVEDAPCCLCSKRFTFEKLRDISGLLNLGKYEKAFVCEECYKELPKKLEGLPVKYKNRIIGQVEKVEWVK